MTSILGISAFYHDSAATILIDGKIVAAAQEERFTRKKHDSKYPFNAVEFVLNFAKLKLNDVEYIVFYAMTFTVALSLNTLCTRMLEKFSENNVLSYVIYFLIILILTLVSAYIFDYNFNFSLPG